MDSSKVIVVGAGLAGLTASYRLMKKGFSVELYEARRRPGGRAFTVKMGNSYEELGGKFLNNGGESENLCALAKELEIKIEEVPVSNFLTYYDEGIAKNYQSLNFPDEQTILLVEEIARKVPSLGDVLDIALGHRGAIRNVFELGLRCFEGSDTKNLSSSYANLVIDRLKKKGLTDAKQHSKDSNQIVIREISGGVGRLVQALAKCLENRIHYGYPLIRISRGKMKKIALFFDGGKVVEADAAVLAIPCSILRDVEIEEGLFPADQELAVSQLQYGTNAKILLPVAEVKEAMTIPAIAYHLEGSAWFNKNQSVMTLYFGGNSGDFDCHSSLKLSEKLNRLRPSIRALFPQFIFDEQVDPINPHADQYASMPHGTALSWMHEEFSKGSYCNWGVGLSEKYNETAHYNGEIVRKVFRPINGSLFFAGEHTAIEYPGTLEGAVESGERMARLIQRLR